MYPGRKHRPIVTAIMFMIALLLMSACAPATPQVVEKIVKETVVVEKEKIVPQTVVVEKEKVVQQTVVVEKEKKVEAITIVLEERFENLDPHNHNGLSMYLLYKNILGSLTTRDKDGKLIPALATEWKTLEPTVWEFKLRQGVKFTNGEPFNAKAAKCSIDRMVSSATWGTMRQASIWRAIDRAEVVDDYTIKIITKAPSGSLLNNLVLSSILPLSVCEKHPKEPITDPKEIIGTGPYMLTRWVAGEGATVEANPNYYGEPKPKIGRITFQTILEPATRIAALQSGGADIAWALMPAQAVEPLKKDPNLNIYSIESYRVMWVAFHHSHPPFNNPKLREAAQRAVNWDQICKTVLVGEGICGNFMVAPTVFGAATDLDPKVTAYDPERSKALLKEAGFAPGDGPEVRIASVVGTPTGWLEAMVAQLNAVGFKAKLDLMEVGDYLKVRNEGKCEIFANGFTTMTDLDAQVPIMFSCASSRNKYCNPEVDKLMEAAAAETDQAKRVQLYKQMFDLAWADRADIFHYQIITNVGVNKRITGFVPRPDNQLELNLLGVQ